MTTIMIIESHTLMRLGIQQCLTDITSDARIHGIDDVPDDPATYSGPPIDLVLLSVAPSDAEEKLQAAERTYSPKSVILLSDDSSMPALTSTASVRISGYLKKSSDGEVLKASVRLVLAGGTCFPMGSQAITLSNLNSERQPETLSAQQDETSECCPRTADEESRMLGLTPRQYEVLVLLSRGYPMKTVGRKLNIAVATAKSHTESVYQRLDVNNRHAAVYAAVSRGATLGWQSIHDRAAHMGR